MSSSPPYRTLHTPRLTLTLMSLPADLPFRHTLFLDWFPPGSTEKSKWTLKVIEQYLAISAANHIKGAPNGPPQASYTVRLNPTEEYPEGKPIGGVNYFMRGEGTTPGEIGFAFLREYQKQGYGTEAIGEVVRYLRDEAKVGELYASTQESNIGCQKTLQRVGFVPGGYVEMNIGGTVSKLVSFVLPGMKDLEGQMLMWVGTGIDFGVEEEKKVEVV